MNTFLKRFQMDYMLTPRSPVEWATWATMIFLLAVHLGTNYMAVRAVCMRTLNRQRANLVLSAILEQINTRQEGISTNSKIALGPLRYPAPQQIYLHERVFERDGVLRWQGAQVLGFCRLGVDLKTILKCFSLPHQRTGSYDWSRNEEFAKLLEIFQPDEYIVWYDQPRRAFLVVFKNGSDTKTIICAWVFALYFAKFGSQKKGRPLVDLLSETARFMRMIRKDMLLGLSEAGWDLETGALETRSGTRITVKEKVKS